MPEGDYPFYVYELESKLETIIFSRSTSFAVSMIGPGLYRDCVKREMN